MIVAHPRRLSRLAAVFRFVGYGSLFVSVRDFVCVRAFILASEFVDVSSRCVSLKKNFSVFLCILCLGVSVCQCGGVVVCACFVWAWM